MWGVHVFCRVDVHVICGFERGRIGGDQISASELVVLIAPSRRGGWGERGGLGKHGMEGVPHQLGEFLALAASELVVLVALCRTEAEGKPGGRVGGREVDWENFLHLLRP